MEDKNVIVIQGFKEYCALLFMKGMLIDDDNGLLVKTGENTRVGRQIKFTSLSEINTLCSQVKDYIHKAIEMEIAGEKVPKEIKAEVKPGAELESTLSKDKALKKAFDELTPGRQKAYILYFAEPKQEETRKLRIEKYREHIKNGKGLTDRP